MTTTPIAGLDSKPQAKHIATTKVRYAALSATNTPLGLPWDVVEHYVIPNCTFETIETLVRTYRLVYHLMTNDAKEEFGVSNAIYKRCFEGSFAKTDKYRRTKKRGRTITRNPLYRERILFCLDLLPSTHPSYCSPAMQKNDPPTAATSLSPEVDEKVFRARRHMIRVLMSCTLDLPKEWKYCIHPDLQFTAQHIICPTCGATVCHPLS